MTRLRPRSLRAALAVGLLTVLSGCGAVQVPSGPAAADAACADVMLGAPPTMLEQDRRETTSQSTAAWGDGEDVIVLRCGVEPPPPTTDMCTRLTDERDEAIDWIVTEQDGIVTFTTYGREPAVDITVPRSLAPDQPSAVPLEMTRVVGQIPATAHCVGPEDLS